MSCDDVCHPDDVLRSFSTGSSCKGVGETKEHQPHEIAGTEFKEPWVREDPESSPKVR